MRERLQIMRIFTVKRTRKQFSSCNEIKNSRFSFRLNNYILQRLDRCHFSDNVDNFYYFVALLLFSKLKINFKVQEKFHLFQNIY